MDTHNSLSEQVILLETDGAIFLRGVFQFKLGNL